jgi:hypothetical protein
MAEEMRIMSEEGIVQFREGVAYLQEQGDPSVEAQLVRRPDGMGSLAVIREGYRVVDYPPEQEGRCAHQFEDLKSFAEYISRHCGTKAGTVDIMVEECGVVAIIGTSHREPVTLYCSMVTEPAWDAWTGIFDRELSQRELQQHIRSWRETLGDHGALLTALAAIQVSTGQAMSSNIDTIGGTRLASAEGKQDVRVNIPPILRVNVPIHEAVDAAYDLEVLVSITPTPLSFTLSCPKLERHERQARRDFAGTLRGLLDDSFLVSIGKAAHMTREVQSG